MNRHVGCILLALAAGCSGIKTYQESGPRNVLVRTDVSKVEAALDIHDVGPDCRTAYRGTVALDKASVSVGIPAERLSYLTFNFASSSFLRGSSSSSAGTLLKPRLGYSYEIQVSYRDDIYSVVIRESDARKSFSRELPRRSLERCGSS
jgi:hypothetical protein